MPSIFTRARLLPSRILAPALSAGLTLHCQVAQAQSNGAAEQSATPGAVATNTPAALDLGECPDSASGLDQGKTFACSCPAQAAPVSIYGTDVYTPDSGICTAAMHAGALPKDTAGSVIIQVIASPQVFKGATKNGAKSEAWAQAAEAAFQFVPAK